MSYLKNWLSAHCNDLVFVVSSVPFVAEVHPTTETESTYGQSGAGSKDESGEKSSGKSNDKWCASHFAGQREEIMRCIFDLPMSRLVFLTGDVHCCYHATMRIGRTRDAVTVHELGAGPIYQLQFGRTRDFFEQCRGKIAGKNGYLPYVSRIDALYNLANAVMQVSVEPPRRVASDAEARHGTRSQTLHWKILRTVARPDVRRGPCDVNDPQFSGNGAATEPAESTCRSKAEPRKKNCGGWLDPAEAVVSSRILFRC
jgi:hypothetical protein